MGEACFLELLNDTIYLLEINRSISNIASTPNDFVARDFDEVDSFRISRLKTDRCTSGYVKTISVSGGAIKRELRVCLNEVVMRSNL